MFLLYSLHHYVILFFPKDWGPATGTERTILVDDCNYGRLWLNALCYDNDEPLQQKLTYWETKSTYALSWGTTSWARGGEWPAQNFGLDGPQCNLVPPIIGLYACSQRKISKTGATRCQILRLKCIKFAFCWSSVPDPTGGAYSAPKDLLAVFKGPNAKRR